MQWSIKQGAKLIELRVKKGFTQHYVAQKLQVSDGAVGFWEQGRNAPKEKNLRGLAFLYNVSVEELLDESALPDKPPEPAEPLPIILPPLIQVAPKTMKLLNLFCTVTDLSEQQIIADALNAYAVMFNWTAHIEQNYLDGTDQLG